MCRTLLALFMLALPSALVAQDFKIEPAKSPQDSLKCIKPRLGFTVELMVAEPHVQSPIAFAWGADGKFWVVEMGDYPLGLDGKGKPGGKIKYLEKSNPEGSYDKMTVFMDGLGFPTGVFPYAKGVLVTCAPTSSMPNSARTARRSTRKSFSPASAKAINNTASTASPGASTTGFTALTAIPAASSNRSRPARKSTSLAAISA